MNRTPDRTLAAYDDTAPVEQVWTIPAARYTDPRIAEPERRTAWSWTWQRVGAGEDHIAAVKAKAEARIADGWTIRDAQLAAHGPYVLGDRVATPDFLRATLATARKARPAFKELCVREGLTDWT